MTARIALAVTLAAASCGASAATAPPPSTTVAPPDPHPPTTTAPPPVVVPSTTAAPSPRPAPTTGDDAGGTAEPDDGFWRRLADCECASGRCGGAHVGYFQFSPDTARKVGIDGSEPYEEQRAAAQEWARRIHPREGTTAGWPHCWWVAAA